MAVVISVTCVLFFGEIIPSAIFTGPNQLHIGARLAPVVRVLIWLTYPLSFPISKLLDKILGEDEDMTRYGRLCAQMDVNLDMTPKFLIQMNRSQPAQGSCTAAAQAA